MKREGRQHGLVRTCPIIILPSPLDPRPPQPKHIYSSCSATTAGPFARVTCKCGRAECPECQVCSAAAAGKAKGKKAKGTLKQRTADAVHEVPAGFSATGILDHLAGTDYTDHLEAADDR